METLLGRHRFTTAFKECTGALGPQPSFRVRLAAFPSARLSPPPSHDFPGSQIRFATGRSVKGLGAFGTSRLLRGFATPAPARRENAPVLLDRFDPSLVSFDGTSHLHRLFIRCFPSRSSPPRGFPCLGRLRPQLQLSAVAIDTGTSGARAYGLPHSLLAFHQQPTRQKRQFLNFFDCPGAAAPPLRGSRGASPRSDSDNLQHRRLAPPSPRKPADPQALAPRAQSKIISPLGPPEDLPASSGSPAVG
jgi:hypothetical protein